MMVMVISTMIYSIWLISGAKPGHFSHCHG